MHIIIISNNNNNNNNKMALHVTWNIMFRHGLLHVHTNITEQSMFAVKNFLSCMENVHFLHLHVGRGDNTPNRGSKEDPTYDEVHMNCDVLRNIQLDSNPAYGLMTIEPSVNDPTYEEIETKLQLTANPAYEPIGLPLKSQ